jgi:preprotein translocase subunit SecD
VRPIAVASVGVELSSEDLTEVYLRKADDSDRIDGVTFALTPWGTQRFADLTGRNIGAKLAIVLEPFRLHGRSVGATVLSDAVIEGAITNGHVVLHFPHVAASAREALAIDAIGLQLQLGNLPAELIEAP